jgi:hypothetical protein
VRFYPVKPGIPLKFLKWEGMILKNRVATLPGKRTLARAPAFVIGWRYHKIYPLVAVAYFYVPTILSFYPGCLPNVAPPARAD